MSKDVHTITPDEDVYNAMHLLGNENIKHLPVVENGKLIGIISYKDIIAIQPDLIELVSFKSSLTKEQKDSLVKTNE